MSSASIVAEDLVSRLRDEPLTSRQLTLVTKIVVGSLTIVVFILAMLPSGAGFLVPIASLGFGLGLQLVPSALGMLHFRGITETGAFAGLLAGCLVMGAQAVLSLDIVVGPSISGLIANIILTIVISRMSAPVSQQSQEEFHDMFDHYMRDNCDTCHLPSKQSAKQIV